MKVPLGLNTDTASLAWVISALGQVRTQDESKAIRYLGDVADDVVFEMESAARRREYR